MTNLKEQLLSEEESNVRIDNEDSFKKFDNNKPRISLVEPQFIVGLAKILTLGANKYGAYNWRKGANDIDRIKDAMLRHTLAYLDGERVDPESGESHLYHIAANLMFLDYFDRNVQ
jgi:hypothetical protein